MSRFIQLHMLTSYPPSNLNRDDLGRPKTARVGGFDRLRVSSQSLKRAWRTSDIFQTALDGHIGTRTKRMGVDWVKDELLKKGVAEKKAREWAMEIAAQFGKLKTAKKAKDEAKDDAKAKEEPKEKDLDRELEIEQLAHIGPEEKEAIFQLIEVLATEKRGPKKEELALLKKRLKAVDIAFFGRMLASQPDFNVEAAVQVSHAITIHAAAVEDDYFTAVDDLNKGEEDVGAGHIGEAGFGAGVFYTYVCVDTDLLVENLSGDRELAKKALASFVEVAATVPPSGKQNSFASRAYASYVLAEGGDRQPRSLAVAFLKPVAGEDVLAAGIESLETTRANLDKVYYGLCAGDPARLNALTGEGSLKDVVSFVTGQINPTE